MDDTTDLYFVAFAVDFERFQQAWSHRPLDGGWWMAVTTDLYFVAFAVDFGRLQQVWSHRPPDGGWADRG